MPGHSPSKTGVNAPYVPGIHVFYRKQGADGRDKPGHDEDGYAAWLGRSVLQRSAISSATWRAAGLAFSFTTSAISL